MHSGRFKGRCARLCAFGGCAFPLVMLSGLKFSFLLAFWLSAGVLVRVEGVKSITGNLKGFRRCAFAFAFSPCCVALMR